MDIKMQPIKNIQLFMEIVDCCSGDVFLVSKDHDLLNLKSKLTQYIALPKLLTSQNINEFILSVNNPDDAEKIIQYMMEDNMIQKWHSIHNHDDRPELGKVVGLNVIYDGPNFTETDGVWTNEGFKIIGQIPDFNQFMCIIDWKYKD